MKKSVPRRWSDRIADAWVKAYDLVSLAPGTERFAWLWVRVARQIRDSGVRRHSSVVDQTYDATQYVETIIRLGPLELELSDLAGTRVYRVSWMYRDVLFCSESVRSWLWTALERTVGRWEDDRRDREWWGMYESHFPDNWIKEFVGALLQVRSVDIDIVNDRWTLGQIVDHYAEEFGIEVGVCDIIGPNGWPTVKFVGAIEDVADALDHYSQHRDWEHLLDIKEASDA